MNKTLRKHIVKTDLLSLPMWLYHVPTFIFSGFLLIALLGVLVNREIRMYHGAEHKVTHWYSKKDAEYNIESVQKCSRIYRCCGTNLLATIVIFQI